MYRVNLDTSPDKLTVALLKKKKIKMIGFDIPYENLESVDKVWGKMSANNENDEKSEPIAGFQDVNAFTQVVWKYTKQD